MVGISGAVFPWRSIYEFDVDEALWTECTTARKFKHCAGRKPPVLITACPHLNLHINLQSFQAPNPSVLDVEHRECKHARSWHEERVSTSLEYTNLQQQVVRAFL
jgi:hypothetical protein